MRRIALAALLAAVASGARAEDVRITPVPPVVTGNTCAGCSTNVVPKTVGSNALGDSSITDDGTTVSTTEGLTIGGHLQSTGAAPALTSCGTDPAIAGSDSAGEVTMGTGSPTGCVITFNAAYTSAPYCVVTWQANLAAMGYTISNTALTLTQTGASSNKVNYACVARSGG